MSSEPSKLPHGRHTCSKLSPMVIDVTPSCTVIASVQETLNRASSNSAGALVDMVLLAEVLGVVVGVDVAVETGVEVGVVV